MRTVDRAWLNERARAHGFDEAGIAPVDLPDEAPRLRAWLEAGYAGTMSWLEREPEVRIDLRERFPWAKSVVVVMRRYAPAGVPATGLAPYVSSYALGPDYHDVLLPRLRELGAELGEAPSHAYVDTGPALERRLAQAAGLGWTGHNTLLLNARRGSRSFLGALVSGLELAPTPGRSGSCGTCTACQPACPTSAFVRPGVLDARRCISYLTIEFRGMIPRDLRPAMGQWLFGCDLCQTCCPFEVRSRAPSDPEFVPGPALDLDLESLLRLDEAGFRTRFRRTPLWRPRRIGLLRNAVIVVANGEHHEALPAVRALLADPSPVLREVASWAIASCPDPEGHDALVAAVAREPEVAVRALMAGDLRRLEAASGSGRGPGTRY
jgi:epoxyqueuosine reductase